MNRMIAYCGLDCEACDARLATVRNDDALRASVARLWSQLNGVEITPDQIRCTGCRTEGEKTPYCESLCPIRACAAGRGYETCGGCGELEVCEAVAAIHRNNAAARRNLNA